MVNSTEVLLKTKNRTIIWSSNPTPGHIFRENHNSKRYMHPNVHCSTIYNSQDMEATEECPSTEEWIKKTLHIYTMEYSHKSEWNNAICSNMDGLRVYHTKWSKSGRERQISYDITYMWNLKKWIQMNLFTKQKQTHRLWKQIYDYQRGNQEGNKLGVWD